MRSLKFASDTFRPVRMEVVVATPAERSAAVGQVAHKAGMAGLLVALAAVAAMVPFVARRCILGNSLSCLC